MGDCNTVWSTPCRATTTSKMVSVLAPLAYVVFLFSSLYIFSKVYRRRKAGA